jgi:AbrB family looped-hinge helix DNA binding protein
MATATLTSKGQITLPKTVRERLGVESGDRIEFIESERGFVIVPATKDIKSLKGVVPKPKKAVSIEEMNRAIARQGGRLP